MKNQLKKLNKMKKIRIHKTLLWLIAPLLLSSCFSAKEYKRPEVVNEAYYRTDNIQQDNINMAEVSWREMFTDPLLQSYIEEGLTNNIDIRIAVQQILAAEAYVRQGKAGYLPTLSGIAQYTHQELSSNSQFGNQFSLLNQYQISGNLSWEADIWGKIRSTDRAFRASYLQSVAAHKAVKTQLIAEIASAYYQLLALDQQIKTTEKTVINRNNSLETIGYLKDAGIVTAVDVKQTEAQYYTAQVILVDLKNQTHLLENSLSILLGKSPIEIVRNNLDEQLITTELHLGVPAQLLRNRPDVLASEYNLVNAFELTNVARSNFYPALTLTANGGLQSLDIDKLFSPSSLFLSLIGDLTQPILNGRRIRTQFEVAQAEQEQARLDFKNSILIASREVSDALYNYEASTKKIKIRENEYNAYKTAAGYSEELLNNGLANYLEVLTTRENSLNSKLNLINAKYSQLQAVVDLYQALGGGWQ